MLSAAEIMRIKDLLPTELGSDEVRERYAQDLLRRSVFSARMAEAAYLADVRDVCADILEGKIGEAEAKERLLGTLAALGHDTANAESLEDHASDRRLDLVLETQTRMAASAARVAAETEDTAELYPAWELTRADNPAKPREDWPERWNAAGESVGWQGAKRGVWYGSGNTVSFVALKSSPIWDALGAGTGGFDDALGNPFPPFAYGSYMDWFDVDRDTAAKAGLDVDDARAPEAPSLSPDDAELLEAAKRVGWPGLFDDIAEGGR